jgi:hypothetical protein
MYLYRALKGKQLSHRVRPGGPPKAELEEQNRQFEVSMRRLLAEPEQMTAHPTRRTSYPSESIQHTLHWKAPADRSWQTRIG